MSKKISELTAVTDVTPSDLFQVIDVEDPAMASSGTNKKVTAQTLGNFLPVRALGTTTSRTLSERFSDTVNVKDFGAAGDGIQDDTVAIQAALNSNTKLNIYFPKGTYLTTSALVSNGSYVKISGAGIYTTIIKCNHSGDGFNFGLSDPSGLVQMHDLSIQACTDNANSAVNIVMANSGTVSINPSCQIERIETRGFDVTTSQWKNGISVKNAAVSYFKDTLHFGLSNASPSSLETKASCGINMTSDKLAVINSFSNIFVVDACFGIKVVSSGIKGSEGIYITGSNVVNCNYGYYIDNTNTSGYYPVQISIYNCHSEFYKYGIVVNKFIEVLLRDNLLYAFNYAGDIAVRAILVSSCSRGNINGNFIHSDANNVSLKGIEIGDSSSFINVFDNIVNTQQYAVSFSGTTTNCKEERNIQRDANKYRFLNSSSGLNYSSPYTTLFGSVSVTLDSNGYGNITIPSGGTTTKPFYIVNNGDSNNQGDKVFSVYDAGSTPSLLKFRVFPNPGAVSVRANWLALTYA